MWMSNTATASMVVPIAMAVLDELYPKPEQSSKPTRKQSMFKQRSEVDFELLVANSKERRNRRVGVTQRPPVVQIHLDLSNSTSSNKQPADETKKLVTTVDNLNNK